MSTIEKEQKLLELISKVEKVNPQIVDYWQATAIIESLGYTDRLIQSEFGFDDALSLGKYVFDRHHPLPSTKTPPPPSKFSQKFIEELSIFIEQFSRSCVYAIPLIGLMIVETLPIKTNIKILGSELTSLLTLATMASLIVSGGFVQMIARRGAFYISMGEPFQARRACLSLLYLGIINSLFIGLIALYFSFYRGLFSDGYLIIATLYYLLLSLLWMLFAILTTQFRWGASVILISITVVFFILRLGWNLGALEAQILVMSLALIAVIILVIIAFRQDKKVQAADLKDVKLPRLSAIVYQVYPYFFYGIAYFSFIFADRIIAGFAIDTSAGILFAINSKYQRGMDLAIVNFLLFVPLVEYFSYILIRYWYKEAKFLTPRKITKFSRKLRQRYFLTIILILLLFTLSSALTIGVVKPLTWGTIETSQAMIGCLGYCFFVLALLNAILLFSLNQATTVLKTLMPALTINFCLGYILAQVFGVYWAAIGLVIGAAVFMWLSTQQVLQAIAYPDYAYYIGGY